MAPGVNRDSVSELGCPGQDSRQNSVLPPPPRCSTHLPLLPSLFPLDQGTRCPQAKGRPQAYATERALGDLRCLPWIAGNSSKIIMLVVIRVNEHVCCWGLSHTSPPSARARKEPKLQSSLVPGSLAAQWQDWAKPVWWQSLMRVKGRDSHSTFTHPGPSSVRGAGDELWALLSRHSRRPS